MCYISFCCNFTTAHRSIHKKARTTRSNESSTHCRCGWRKWNPRREVPEGIPRPMNVVMEYNYSHALQNNTPRLLNCTNTENLVQKGRDTELTTSCHVLPAANRPFAGHPIGEIVFARVFLPRGAGPSACPYQTVNVANDWVLFDSSNRTDSRVKDLNPSGHRTVIQPPT